MEANQKFLMKSMELSKEYEKVAQNNSAKQKFIENLKSKIHKYDQNLSKIKEKAYETIKNNIDPTTFQKMPKISEQEILSLREKISVLQNEYLDISRKNKLENLYFTNQLNDLKNEYKIIIFVFLYTQIIKEK